MEKISLPTKVDIREDSKNHGVIIIEPCYPGYGITIGNALRRVMLSSLPGAAITCFKIKGVDHEFSTIKGIKEDAVEIVMNLKKINLKVFAEEPVELALKAKGIKEVKAGDIDKNSAVEIVNKDLVICALTEKTSDLEMKIWAEKGLGYIPVEERKGEKPEIGVIHVDAIYTPAQKIGLIREHVRVGDRTDYDKLTLDVETDGTITVKEALKQAAEILVEQFGYLAILDEAGKESNEDADASGGESAEKVGAEKVEVGDGQIESEDVSDVEEKPKKRGRPKKI